MNRVVATAAATAAFLYSAALGVRVACGQLAYDSFDYPAGSALDAKVNPIDGQPWSAMSGNAADDEILLIGASLGYPGLAAPAGNSVSYAGPGKSQRLGFDRTARSGELFYSLVLRVNDLAGIGEGAVFIAGFSDRSGASGIQPTTVGTRLYLREGATSALGAERFNLGVSKNSGFDITFDTTEFALDTPIFVVGSYQIVGSTSGTNDVSKLYINPTSLGDFAPTNSTPSSPIITAPVEGTDLTVGGVPSLAAFVLRQGTGVPAVQVDELRVDTRWARVTPPQGTSWTTDGDAAWSGGQNWSTLAPPNSVSAFVNFEGAISQPRTVSVDLPVAARTLNFNSTHPYTLAGGGTIQLSAHAGINVRAGHHTIATTLTLNDETLFSVAGGASLSLAGDLAGSPRPIIKAGEGLLAMKHVRGESAQILSGAIAVMPGGTTDRTSRLQTLSVAADASLDLSDNDLVVDYFEGFGGVGTWNGSAYTGVAGLISSGRNGGAWNGSGLRTSQADAAGGLTALGVGEASALLDLEPGQTTLWSGQVVDETSALVRYTYAGDATLDGFISGDDYSAIDFAAGVAGASGWVNGDFNYDGVISGDDYAAIDFNLVAQGGSLGDAGVMGARSGVAAVPEPSVFAVAMAAVAGSLLRRRR